MNTQKNELPHANGNAAQTDGNTSASSIPKNSTKIKDEIIRYLREEKEIPAKDMIEVVNATYAKYDKYLQSKVERGDLYGIELRNDAIDALLAAFAPEKVPEIRKKRNGGHKFSKSIFARLPDKMYEELREVVRKKGFSSMQTWLTYIVVHYLEVERRRQSS